MTDQFSRRQMIATTAAGFLGLPPLGYNTREKTPAASEPSAVQGQPLDHAVIDEMFDRNHLQVDLHREHDCLLVQFNGEEQINRFWGWVRDNIWCGHWSTKHVAAGSWYRRRYHSYIEGTLNNLGVARIAWRDFARKFWGHVDENWDISYSAQEFWASPDPIPDEEFGWPKANWHWYQSPHELEGTMTLAEWDAWQEKLKADFQEVERATAALARGSGKSNLIRLKMEHKRRTSS